MNIYLGIYIYILYYIYTSSLDHYRLIIDFFWSICTAFRTKNWWLQMEIGVINQESREKNQIRVLASYGLVCFILKLQTPRHSLIESTS